MPESMIESPIAQSGVTTQAVETLLAVLASTRGGTSINAAARASGINYRTAQRIVEGAAEHGRSQRSADSRANSDHRAPPRGSRAGRFGLGVTTLSQVR